MMPHTTFGNEGYTHFHRLGQSVLSKHLRDKGNHMLYINYINVLLKQTNISLRLESFVSLNT